MKIENLKLLALTDQRLILTQIEEVSSDLGEPDCKLIEPFIINPDSMELTPWFVNLTNQNEFMISSEKILTIMEPNSKLKVMYEDLLKE
jgi:hypothetical protein